MDENSWRQALGDITHGVYVIGYKGPERGQVGTFVASYVMQTSHHPPMVAVAVRHGTARQKGIERFNVFSVNTLASGQATFAERFRSYHQATDDNPRDSYQFGESGCPILKEAISFLECRVAGKIEQGDHWIYVGEVIHGAVLAHDRVPLTQREATDAGLTYRV